jgi:hypothetical protein
MPIQADIIVKKADGTTDVTFKAKQRSSGDSSPARYAQDSGFAIPALQPKLAITSAPHGTSGVERRTVVDGVYPITDSLTGLQIGSVRLSGMRIIVPTNVPTVSVTEAVHQLLNCAASAAVKESGIEGIAPN